MGNDGLLLYETPQFKQDQWIAVPTNELNYQSMGLIRVLKRSDSDDQIDQYEMSWLDQESYRLYLYSFNWRSQRSSIVKSRYIKPIEDPNLFCSQKMSAVIYIEHILTRLSQIEDIPYPDNLYVLREALLGYEQLYTFSKGFKIQQKQICMDSHGNVKVWVNAVLSLNYPDAQLNVAHPQDQMVRDLVKIVAKNTDRDMQPTPCLANYFFQQTQRKNLTFADAIALVEEYANIHRTVIPQWFEAIFYIYDQELTHQSQFEQNIIQQDHIEKQQRQNRINLNQDSSDNMVQTTIFHRGQSIPYSSNAQRENERIRQNQNSYYVPLLRAPSQINMNSNFQKNNKEDIYNNNIYQANKYYKIKSNNVQNLYPKNERLSYQQNVHQPQQYYRQSSMNNYRNSQINHNNNAFVSNKYNNAFVSNNYNNYSVNPKSISVSYNNFSAQYKDNSLNFHNFSVNSKSIPVHYNNISVNNNNNNKKNNNNINLLTQNYNNIAANQSNNNSFANNKNNNFAVNNNNINPIVTNHDSKNKNTQEIFQIPAQKMSLQQKQNKNLNNNFNNVASQIIQNQITENQNFRSFDNNQFFLSSYSTHPPPLNNLKKINVANYQNYNISNINNSQDDEQHSYVQNKKNLLSVNFLKKNTIVAHPSIQVFPTSMINQKENNIEHQFKKNYNFNHLLLFPQTQNIQRQAQRMQNFEYQIKQNQRMIKISKDQNTQQSNIDIKIEKEESQLENKQQSTFNIHRHFVNLYQIRQTKLSNDTELICQLQERADNTKRTQYQQQDNQEFFKYSNTATEKSLQRKDNLPEKKQLIYLDQQNSIWKEIKKSNYEKQYDFNQEQGWQQNYIQQQKQEQETLVELKYHSSLSCVNTINPVIAAHMIKARNL